MDQLQNVLARLLCVLQAFFFALSSTSPFGSEYSKLPPIYWNTSNPMFRIDNTDHIIDVRAARSAPPYTYDSVEIHCPHYRRGLVDEKAMERFVIYRVNREEYDTCRVMGGEDKARAKAVFMCNKPYERQYYSINFRSFTPMPGGMQFKPGQDYYFISTSSLQDPMQTSGGFCHSNNMKVTFKVRHPKDLIKTKSKKRRRKKVSQELDTNGASSSSSLSPKPYDFFLNEASTGEKRKNTKLVKQEASTSNGAVKIAGNGMVLSSLLLLLLSSQHLMLTGRR